jgi:hypothetical protein
MANVESYPEVREYLDDTDGYENTAAEFKQGRDRFLLVTQKGIDGQQLIFKWNGQQFEYWDNETIVDSSVAIPGFPPTAPLDAALELTVVQCGPSSEGDHKKVYDYVVSQVNKFDSSSGPDGGNLACVWTVRHLAKAALGRSITQTDGTSVFGQELHSCFGHGSEPADVRPGGIVISPTQNIPGSKRRNIGHVGFVGAGEGNGRLIYSNSSAHARLEQNFTVGSWLARYRDKKHLSVLFYPLPRKSVAPIA